MEHFPGVPQPRVPTVYLPRACPKANLLLPPSGWGTPAQEHVSTPTTHLHPSLHSLLQTPRAPRVARWAHKWRERTHEERVPTLVLTPTAMILWASPSQALSCSSSSVKWGEYPHGVVAGAQQCQP